LNFFLLLFFFSISHAYKPRSLRSRATVAIHPRPPDNVAISETRIYRWRRYFTVRHRNNTSKRVPETFRYLQNILYHVTRPLSADSMLWATFFSPERRTQSRTGFGGNEEKTYIRRPSLDFYVSRVPRVSRDKLFQRNPTRRAFPPGRTNRVSPSRLVYNIIARSCRRQRRSRRLFYERRRRGTGETAAADGNGKLIWRGARPLPGATTGSSAKSVTYAAAACYVIVTRRTPAIARQNVVVFGPFALRGLVPCFGAVYEGGEKKKFGKIGRRNADEPTHERRSSPLIFGEILRLYFLFNYHAISKEMFFF